MRSLRRKLHGYANRAAEEGIEGIHPENLALKDHSEIAGDGFGDGIQLEFSAQLFVHRRYRLRFDAAGNDQVEVAEIRVHVEGEAVRSDGAGDVDADGREFGLGVSWSALLRSFARPDGRGRPSPHEHHQWL